MPDDTIRRPGAQRLRIDVTEDDEVHIWSKRFDLSPDELKRAILKVGPFAADVERELHKAN